MESSEMGKKIVLGISFFFIICFLIWSVSEIASTQREIESKQSFKESTKGIFWRPGSKTIMDFEIEQYKKEQTKWIVLALISGGLAILCLYGLMAKSQKLF